MIAATSMRFTNNLLKPFKLLTLGSIIASVVLLAFAGGCIKVGPDFVKPSAPLPTEWLEKDSKIKREAADYSKWWTVFDDPVLDSLVVKAYAQNLPLRIAGIRILEARARLGIAVGSQFPQLQQASGDIGATQISDNAANASASNKFFYGVRAGFDVAWEVDLWGRFRRGVESADASLRASVAEYDDVLVSLVAEVAATYALVRTFQERLKFAHQNVQVQTRSFEIADARFRGGAVTELDVAQARSLLRSTQALIPQFNIGVRQGQNALSVLLGMPPRDLQDILEGVKPIPQAPPEIAVSIPADLLRRRPDIRRAELDAATQSAQIGVARADLFPAIAITGAFGLESSAKGGIQSNKANFGDLFNANSFTYFVGPSFTWPILNYGRLKNNVRTQDARFQQLVVNYQQTVLRAAQEVEDAMVAFLRSQEQVKFIGDSVQASKRAVDLSLIQYREGAITYNSVLDSQQFLVQQEDQLATVRGDVARNLIAVYKALGGGWEIRKDQEFVPEEIKKEMRERTDWGDLLSREEVESPPSVKPDF